MVRKNRTLRVIATSVILPIVLGGTTALAVAWATRPRDKGGSPPDIYRSVSTPEEEGELVGSLSRRVGTVENLTRNISNAAGVQVSLEEPSMIPVETSMAMPTLEQARESARIWQETLRSDFDAEREDPLWASVAEEDFRIGLDELGHESQFFIETIECRTSRCRAVLRLIDETESGVTAASDAVIGYEFGHNCAINMYAEPVESHGDSKLVVFWVC